jgi:hypothetical protein
MNAKPSLTSTFFADWKDSKMNQTPRLLELEERIQEHGGSYDTAKPQPWLDDMSARGYDYETLRIGTVWFYDSKSGIFGQAYPITDEAADILDEDAKRGDTW